MERLRAEASVIDGVGAYANIALPDQRKIGELRGKLISASAGRKKAASMERMAIIELPSKVAIDLTDCQSPLRYVPPSCSPNTWLRVIQFRVEFYALRAIKKNEELTCDYGSTHHQGTRLCTCKSPVCRGWI